MNLGSKRTGMTYIKSASAEILLILAGERESIVKSFVILVKKKRKNKCRTVRTRPETSVKNV